jgi:uracil-DNA glycosylase family 4
MFASPRSNARPTICGRPPPRPFLGKPLEIENHADRRAARRSGGPHRSSFCRPCGWLLRQTMTEAGMEPAQVYLTTGVRHFKWFAGQRGKKADSQKVALFRNHACRPWLDAELRVVNPKVLVCLGATAAQSLLGRTLGVIRQRGRLVNSPLAEFVIATVHPSSGPASTGRRIQTRADAGIHPGFENGGWSGPESGCGLIDAA